MEISIEILPDLFEPFEADGGPQLSDGTVQVLMRQDATMLVSAITPWTSAIFNSMQVGRLASELRALAGQESLDDRIRDQLIEAADFIATKTAAKSHCFVVFVGN